MHVFPLRVLAELLTLLWLEVQVIYYSCIRQVITLDFRVTRRVQCKELFWVCKALDHRATGGCTSLHCPSLIS